MGIHLTVLGTRTRPVLSPEIIPSIVTPEGFFYETIDQLNNANPTVEDMEKEIHAQIMRARESGLHFVYLDWHRSVPDTLKEIIIGICDEQRLIYGQEIDGSTCGFKRIQLMPETWPTQRTPDGQIIYYAAPAFNNEQQQLFFDGLAGLKPGKWITIAHPGLGEPQRMSVTELFCSARTKQILKSKNIQMVSFYDLWNEKFGKEKIDKKGF